MFGSADRLFIFRFSHVWLSWSAIYLSFFTPSKQE